MLLFFQTISVAWLDALRRRSRRQPRDAALQTGALHHHAAGVLRCILIQPAPRSHLHLDEHGRRGPRVDRGVLLPLLGAGRLDAAGRRRHHARPDRRRARRLLRRALRPHVRRQRAQARGLMARDAYRSAWRLTCCCGTWRVFCWAADFAEH